MPDPLDIAQTASLARTALTDPAGLPEGSGIATVGGPAGDPSAMVLDADARSYAVDRLDEIIEALDPSLEIRENFAAALRTHGGGLATLQDTMTGPALDDPEPARSAYGLAVDKLTAALDLLDEAADALHPLP